MQRAKALFASILCSIAMTPMLAAQTSLEESFRDPPAQARPHTWWHWMNGNISRSGITADLEAMKRIGLGGAQIFNVSEGIPDGPIVYNSDEWRGLVKFAASEAKRLGLELCIHNCAGWSSSGGPWVTPDLAMQTLTTSETRVAGGTRFTGVLPQPATKAGYYRDVAVLAFPTPKDDKTRIADLGPKSLREYQYGMQPSTAAMPADATIAFGSIVDVSSRMGADGKLVWDVPEGGEWTILRIGHTPTGAMNAPSPASGRGLEVDKLSREAFDAYWVGGMAPLIKELGPLAGTALRNCLIDSYEMGCQNWTPRFREEFRTRCDYDPLLYLPVITGRVVDSGPASERFLWDFRRTIGDLFADNYYSQFATRCKENGLLSSVEPYDGPFECEQAARDADIVMGEFWADGGMSGSCKLAASVGHTYGKKFVGAESFTAFPTVGKWQNHPASLKGVGDLMYTSGINRYIIHRYAHQPWSDVNPGMTMGQWGTHFERTTTWWEQGSAWITYLARCQSLLQQGGFAADVCIFMGEASPNGYLLDDELKSAGYDYDTCGTDVLLNRTSAKDGRIVLTSGMSYRVLVLPETTFMTPRLCEKVRELVRAGATVIGPRPTESPSNSGGSEASAAVARLGSEVWGDCDGKAVKRHAFGSGFVVSGQSPAEVLAGMSIAPDCTLGPAESGGPMPKGTWIHRVIDGTDVYFVSNQRPRSEEVACSFRVSGRVPELWHADTGVVERAPVWSEQDGRTVVPVRFEPWGSVFVVFRSRAKGQHLASVTPPASVREERRVPAIVVTKAMYEAVDGAGGADVTAKVAAMVAAGETEIPANNSAFGDPTYNHVKRLRVEYTLDGKAASKLADENTSAVLYEAGGPDTPMSYQLVSTRSGGADLVAFSAGAYEFTQSKGKPTTVKVASIPSPIDIAGPWSVNFQSGRGAPDSIKLDTLESLSHSSIPGVKYFSGTAAYEATFNVPSGMISRDHACFLQLGDVKVIAEVMLNGKSLGVWWKPPFEGDVSGLLREGTNTLTIRVTDTWVNRLIGDEQYPDDCEWNGITIKKWPAWFVPGSPSPLKDRPVKERLTFTTWKHWHKDSPLPDSGLLGPVRLRVGVRVPIPSAN